MSRKARLVKLRIASEKLGDLIHDLDRLPYEVFEHQDGQICIPARPIRFSDKTVELDVLIHPDTLAALAGHVAHDIVRRRYSSVEKSTAK